MGLSFNLGRLSPSLFTDSSLNVGIGAAPSGSYKLEVTGTAKVSSTLLVSGAATLSSTLSAGATTINGNDSPLIIQATTVNKGIVIEYKNSAGTRRGYVGYGGDSSSLFEISNNENGAIDFRTNAAFAMRITSGGNVGIGVTPSSWSTANSVKALQIPAGSFWNYNDSNLYVGLNYYWDGSNRRYVNNGLASEYQQNGDHIFFTAPTGTAGNVVTLTEKMRITSGGKVTIPSGAYSLSYFSMNYTSANAASREWAIGSDTSGWGSFSIAQATTQGGSTLLDRIIITSGGVVQIAGLTSNGTVSTQSSNGSLYVSSDANLKIEDGYIENGLEKVLALKPRYFYWKDKEAFSSDRQLGFYAQEVNAISEETANTPPEGCGWGIYDRGLVALLTSAIQEQQATITSLQDRLTKGGL